MRSIHFKAALDLQNKPQIDRQLARDPAATKLDKLVAWMCEDLKLRGLSQDRMRSFNLRLRACPALISATERSDINVDEWSARPLHRVPHREWSPQQREVLDAIAQGLGAKMWRSSLVER